MSIDDFIQRIKELNGGFNGLEWSYKTKQSKLGENTCFLKRISLEIYQTIVSIRKVDPERISFP